LPFTIQRLRCINTDCGGPLELDATAPTVSIEREYIGCTQCAYGYRLRVERGLVTVFDVFEPGLPGFASLVPLR
jgi:hypothetical protein